VADVRSVLTTPPCVAIASAPGGGATGLCNCFACCSPLAVGQFLIMRGLDSPGTLILRDRGQATASACKGIACIFILFILVDYTLVLTSNYMHYLCASSLHAQVKDRMYSLASSDSRGWSQDVRDDGQQPVQNVDVNPPDF
jgi:hypothetical protein